MAQGAELRAQGDPTRSPPGRGRGIAVNLRNILIWEISIIIWIINI